MRRVHPGGVHGPVTFRAVVRAVEAGGGLRGGSLMERERQGEQDRHDAQALSCALNCPRGRHDSKLHQKLHAPSERLLTVLQQGPEGVQNHDRPTAEGLLIANGGGLG
jgi:hypothetical protein